MKLLKYLWARWLKIGKAIGNFQAQVIFTIFYFLVMFPVGIGIRFFSDPLTLKKKKKKTNFNEWEHPEEDVLLASKPY